MQENGNSPHDESNTPLPEERDALAEVYQSPFAAPSGEEEIVVAEVVEPVQRKPRIWTVACVGLLTLPVAILVAGGVVAFVAIADAGVEVFQNGGFKSWFEDYSQTRLGLAVLVLPGQAVFLVMAVGAAVLSPKPLSQRLGLGCGVLPLWTWFVFVIATPIVSVLSSELLSWFVDDLSEQLKMMEQMMYAHTDGFMVGLILMVAVVPGVVEELMFRGYIQTRLAERWHPALAIVISAVLFSMAHLDPVHMLGVIPLGLWLGAVAWRADSVLPAMLCHAANNTLAVAATKYGQMQTLDLALDPMTMSALVISLPAFLLSLYIFRSN